MKINWYSPLPPAKSGIADFTAAVLPALQESFDVCLWTGHAAPVELAAGYPVRRLRSLEAAREVPREDTINVFNIGNSFEFHGEIFDEAQRRPGILLMHDAVLTDFFHHYLADIAPNGDLAAMTGRYGRETIDALVARRRGEAKAISPRVQLSLLGATLKNALCAISMSDDSFEALKGDGTCPVYRLDLPFRNAGAAPTTEIARVRGSLVMFGHFGDNRRIPELLAAIGSYPRRDQLKLDIFGQYHDEAGLRRLIEQCGVSGQVRHHGHVPDAVLDRSIASAALVVNLRYPSMGEASLSQLRAWSFGAPTIVTPIAWYAGLPPETALTAPLEGERDALHHAFTLALDQPELLAEVGAAGRAYLERRHSPEAFVRGFAEILNDWPTISGRWTAERLTQRAAIAAAPWKPLLSEPSWQGVANALSALAPMAFQNPAEMKDKRLLSGKTGDHSQYVEAAQTYVDKLSARERRWLHRKPYDPDPGNAHYFQLQYQIMNLLQAMQIRPGGRILEIGAGPGWVTEQLLMLGFSVDVLEPAQTLIDIAQQRCAALAQHYGTQDVANRVSFQCGTLEDAAYPPHRFDAVIFYDVLHHIIDEQAALTKCAEALRPGGLLGVVEGSWSSADLHLEALLQEEMRIYGTLENPFTPDYLDELLTQIGFINIVRYFPVNGFFPSAVRNQLLISAAGEAATDTNNLIARKPYGAWPTTASGTAPTAGEITVKSGGIAPQTRMAKLTIALKNTGATVWLPGRTSPGGVTLALRRGAPGAADFLEAPHRYRLPEVLPQDEIVVSVQYSIPPDAPLYDWVLDLVSEERCWFSALGTNPAPIATIGHRDRPDAESERNGLGPT